jgi:hypothetical protein
VSSIDRVSTLRKHCSCHVQDECLGGLGIGSHFRNLAVGVEWEGRNMIGQAEEHGVNQ